MTAINKNELISDIASNGGVTKAEAEKHLSNVVQAITNNLKSGNEIKLVGFGNFKVKDRPARMGRNPHTGAPIPIAASQAVTFKASKTLIG